MKVVFICGSLEPGCDGVGDYVRRLAGNMINKGCDVTLISAYDHHVTDLLEVIQNSEGTDIKTIRIAKLYDSKRRFNILMNKVNEIAPDWISIQFVPFSFHSKGLPFYLGRYLRRITKGRKLHIMFHELWIGMHREARNKEILWGYLQRLVIVSLIRKLHPQFISTQCGLYKAQLKRLGFDSEILPLFSNIPKVKYTPVLADDDRLCFVLFGGIHNTGAPVDKFAKEVKSYSRKVNKLASLLILGRGGEEQFLWEKVWKENEMEVRKIGEKSPEDISKCLQIANYGITTTVYDKVEKSGSVAAMIEHGLNVVCVSGPWKPKFKFDTTVVEHVYEFREGELDSLLNIKQAVIKKDILEEVSGALINSFNSINNIA